MVWSMRVVERRLESDAQSDKHNARLDAPTRRRVPPRQEHSYYRAARRRSTARATTQRPSRRLESRRS